jgi:hypothetical protein
MIRGHTMGKIRAAGAAAWLVLLLQSLAPPGYMPGSLADGWPVVLCPEGLPAGFLRAHHHHDGAADEFSHLDSSLEGYCPLGGVLDGSAISVPGMACTDPRLPGPALPADYRAPGIATRYPTRFSRGPPA